MIRFNNILYVVEGDAADQAVGVGRAVALAQANQAQLALLRIVGKPRLGPFRDALRVGEYEARVRERESQTLAQLLAPGHGRLPISHEVRFGAVSVEVVRDVLEHGRDLVIKRSGDSGAGSMIFGGTDQHLLRNCPCPVWILPPRERPQYRRIMAAVDFDPWNEDEKEDELNRSILELASSLAIADFAELHVAHAWESVSESVIRVFGSDLPDTDVARNVEREQRSHMARLELLDQKLRRWIGEEGYAFVSPRLHLRRGKALNVIPDLSVELKVDLVVMGTVSRSGIPGLLIGNTAEVILNNIECAVVAVKPPGFVSPARLPRR